MAGDDKIDGGSGNDLIYGGAGADNITGGTGNDLIYVGTTAADDGAVDTLQYTAGVNDGADVVVGFNSSGDLINVHGGTFGGSVTVASAAGGANTLVTLAGGTTITLLGVSSATITAADFTFI